MESFWNSNAPLTGDQYAHLMLYMMLTSAVTGVIWLLLCRYRETLLFPNLIKTFVIAYVMGWITMIFGLISLLSVIIGTGMLLELMSGHVQW